MKRLLILLGVVLVLAVPAVMADDDDMPAPAVGETRVIKMQVEGDGDAPSMMQWFGKGGGRGMMMCREGDDNCGPGMGMCCNLLDCKELNLTKEQTTKIQDINFAHKNAMIDLKAALEKAQLRMGKEMKADSPDKARALAAVKEVNAAKGQMAEARVNHMFNLRGVLTAEQLEKMNACKGAGMCGGGPMGGGMCGGGGKCGPMGAGKGAGASCGKPCPGAAGCGKGR